VRVFLAPAKDSQVWVASAVLAVPLAARCYRAHLVTTYRSLEAHPIDIRVVVWPFLVYLEEKIHGRSDSALAPRDLVATSLGPQSSRAAAPLSMSSQESTHAIVVAPSYP
jgi:hypothetical protein